MRTDKEVIGGDGTRPFTGTYDGSILGGEVLLGFIPHVDCTATNIEYVNEQTFPNFDYGTVPCKAGIYQKFPSYVTKVEFSEAVTIVTQRNF